MYFLEIESLWKFVNQAGRSDAGDHHLTHTSPSFITVPLCSMLPSSYTDADRFIYTGHFFMGTEPFHQFLRPTCLLYIYSFPEPRPTRDLLLTQALPLCSRAKARFGYVLPRCSPMLPLCSLVLSPCSPLLPHCSLVLPLSYFPFSRVLASLNGSVYSARIGC